MDYQILKANFEAHGFHTSYFSTAELAVKDLERRIQGETIAIGGSITVQQLGLEQVLASHNQVIWHWSQPGEKTLRQASLASVYITSANALSLTGEMVNIDGTGNRVAMTMFGPRKVFVIVGNNKIEPNLHSALARAQNVAAPKNAMRLQVKTPCVANGGDRCYDCNSPERICRSTVIMERPNKGMEVEVILIDQPLGY